MSISLVRDDSYETGILISFTVLLKLLAQAASKSMVLMTISLHTEMICRQDAKIPINFDLANIIMNLLL